MKTSHLAAARTSSRHSGMRLAIAGLIVATSVAGCFGGATTPSPSYDASQTPLPYSSPEGQASWPTASPNFTATGSMSVPRQSHSATRLKDGSVLIVGGWSEDGSAFSTAELYDPATRKFRATGSMVEGRSGHMATLLKDGRVLIVGGYGEDNGVLASAELYDPATGEFTKTGSMSTARGEAVEALLPDGRVLVAGGEADPTSKDARLASAEIYDPARGTFSPTGPMQTARVLATATLLPSGKVLVAGGYDAQGYLASAELYDPATGKFTAAGSMSLYLHGHTATLLRDGRVLVAGGASGCSASVAACIALGSKSTELYDPATGKFAKTGSMSWGRILPTATLLNDGRVLIAGGFTNATGPYNTAEVYDPSTGRFSDVGSMGAPRGYHTATLLTSGPVLIAGGTDVGGGSVLSTAELFTP
jgi:hypothetical protein